MATYTGIQEILKEFLRRCLPSGIISPFAGSSVPKGWLLCNGSAVSRTTYSRLFSAIGTAYGEGDGSTTFNLPDLRETVPIGVGTRESGVTNHDVYELGTFKDDQIVSHTHTFSGTTGGMSANATGYAYIRPPTNKGTIATSGNITYGSETISAENEDSSNGSRPYKLNLNVSHTHSFSGTTGSTGGGTTTHGKQLGVNYIIKY